MTLAAAPRATLAMRRLPLAREWLPGETGNPSRRARAPSERRPWRAWRASRFLAQLSATPLGRGCGSWPQKRLHKGTGCASQASSRRVASRTTSGDKWMAARHRRFRRFRIPSCLVFRNVTQYGLSFATFPIALLRHVTIRWSWSVIAESWR